MIKGGKIKVFYLNPSLDFGGAGRVMLTVTKHMRRDVFFPSIVVLNSGGGLSQLVPEDVPVYSLQPGLDLWHKGKLLKGIDSLRSLVRLINQERPEVTICDVARLSLLLIVARALSKHHPYLIIRWGNIKSLSLKESKSLPGKFECYLIKALLPSSDCIVTASQGAKYDLVTSFNVPGEKIHVIPNPIDIEYIKQASNHPVEHPWFRDKTPVIISIGRLVTRKGIDYLLDAFATVRREVECRLAIVGDGPQRRELESQAAQLNIDKHTAFLGYQENPFKYIARAAVLVHPALWEGFGYVIVEAMACGTPVVATRCPGGPPEIITDGRNGLLVPPADSQALAKAILSLFGDEALRKRLSEQGRERARDFNANRIVRQYEELILSCRSRHERMLLEGGNANEQIGY